MSADNNVHWSALPLANVSDWTAEQAYDGHGPCQSCGRVTYLRADPIVFQKVCRPCWEALMYGTDDD